MFPLRSEAVEGEKEGFRWFTARNQLATIRYGKILLHSLYDPLKEAEQLSAPILAVNPRVVLILGLGLAYHVKALRRKLPDTEILIFEPCAAIYQAARTHRYENWPEDSGIHVFTMLEELEDFLIEHCIYAGDSPLPYLWIYPPYHQLVPEQITKLQAFLYELKIRQATNRKTLQEKKPGWLRNIMANWPRLLSLPNFSRLAGAFSDIPCVVVGAGPSLGKTAAHLQHFAGRGIVFVSSSVLAWLHARGIRPDLTAVSEGEDVSMHLRNAHPPVPDWTFLGSSTHPNNFVETGGQHSSFHCEKWLANLLQQEPFIPHGGNVTSAAFTMAIVMGCNPIILVGHDLSYEGDELHVPGVRNPREEEAKRFRRYAMAGRNGVVYGHSAMVSYLSWFEESARYLAKIRPDLKIINATEGGVRIRGFEEMPLERAAELYGQKPVEILPVLQTRLNACPIDPVAIRHRLGEMLRDLSAMDEGEALLSSDPPAWQLYHWLADGAGGVAGPDRGELESRFIEEACEVVRSLMEQTDSLPDLPPRALRE